MTFEIGQQVKMKGISGFGFIRRIDGEQPGFYKLSETRRGKVMDLWIWHELLAPVPAKVAEGSKA